MGDPKKTKKHYDNPLKPWNKGRLDEERTLNRTYGFKNKRELKMLQTTLRGKRQNARELLALGSEQRLKREKELLNSLNKMGLLKADASLDDILSLSVEGLLERRLQTIVWRKNLARTIKQARQFIVHGHIAVDGRKVDRPSYLVPRGEEERIGYYGKPPLLELPKKERKEELKKAFEEVKGAKEKSIELPETEEVKSIE